MLKIIMRLFTRDKNERLEEFETKYRLELIEFEHNEFKKVWM